jgi:hypothetical protein
MSLTSKSPRKVILVALAVGKEALRDYSHPCSPKVFTQPQLFACLVLMTFLDTDYRGVEEHLTDLPAYAQWLGLKRIPDHSTLHKAGQRFFGAGLTDRLLATSVRLMMGRRKLVHRAAADSSGLESGHRSPYFVRRCARGQKGLKNPLYQTTTYTRFPKLTLLVDTRTHQVLALLTGRGPRPDTDELDPLLARRPRGVTLLNLLADAGYDSEANHEFLRDEHGIRSLIPAKHGRPSKSGKPPTGHYRRLMKSQLRTRRRRRRHGYTQRAQIETVFSMIKRNLTDGLFSRSYHAQNREMRLLVLVHNIMILLGSAGFSTEPTRPDSARRLVGEYAGGGSAVGRGQTSAILWLGPMAT